MADELVLLARLYDLLCWLLPNAERFPRVYRNNITQRLMDAALDCQEAVFTRKARARHGVCPRCRRRTPRSIGCVFTCVWRTSGAGLTTVNLNT